ncbi:chaperonin 10-like protein [Parachaetomium inaequale]|uniref:Chaperonin 10-like protein n=1 Tax=Parachaetomium inaequale TaxID=2588326 RepID=A0AAN6SQW1_9PEZI|nr:chaperonin 10-like protein [Parachaetomium inaequale]
MAPENQAAWLAAAKTTPLQVSPAPYTPPGAGQLVIRNSAVAINPVDWQKQLLGDALLGYIAYPFVLGGDAAGTVVEVGPGVTRFRVGDRVVGAALSFAESVNSAAEGAFQLYTVLREHMAAPIPAGVSEEAACVIPLTLCTVAYGLFHAEFLALDLPVVRARSAVLADGKVRAVIVTGGSSSAGSNAVQLAVAAGYEVISTASPKNFDHVRKLGASHVFDYHLDANTLADKMLAALEGRVLAGALAIGEGSVDACAAVLGRHADTANKFIASASFMPPGGGASEVKVRFIDLKDAAEPDGQVARIWKDYLPQALEAGQFVPAPAPMVVGKGLEKIQEAMGVQMKGVSAQKVVVML